MELSCPVCSHDPEQDCDVEIDIGNGWDVVGDEVQCRTCKTRFYVGWEEDADCEGWFELEQIKTPDQPEEKSGGHS